MPDYNNIKTETLLEMLDTFYTIRMVIQWGGSLKEIRPQDFGSDLEKIKALVQNYSHLFK